MSIVSSMELEGISKFCSTNVIMKRTMISNSARETKNSTDVSRRISWAEGSSSFSCRAAFAVSGMCLKTSLSAYQLKGSRPASFIKEVNDDVSQKRHTVSGTAHLVLIFRRYKRPVDKHRPPDHVLLRNEAPVTAVVAVVAIVAHGKVAVRRHDDIAALNMLRHFRGPLLIGYVDHFRRLHGGKIVSIRIIVSPFVQRVRLIQFLAVAVDHAIT